MKRLFTTLLLLFFSMTCFADGQFTFAQIELVIFLRPNFASYVPEHLPKEPIDEAPILITPQPNPKAIDGDTPYQYLPKKYFHLSALTRELGENTANLVVAHLAWRQPIEIGKYGKVVQFFAGVPYSTSRVNPTLPFDHTQSQQSSDTPGQPQNAEQDQAQDTLNPAIPGNPEQAPVDDEHPPTTTATLEQVQTNLNWQVTGHIRLVKINNYYNVQLYVRVKQRDANGFKSVVLQQIHAATPGKLRYFDHPAMGVILLVKPYKPTLAAPAA